MIFFPATTLEHAPLEAVYIYFDTATYDEVKRDEKVIFLAALVSVVKRDHIKIAMPILVST